MRESIRDRFKLNRDGQFEFQASAEEFLLLAEKAGEFAFCDFSGDGGKEAWIELDGLLVYTSEAREMREIQQKRAVAYLEAQLSK